MGPTPPGTLKSENILIIKAKNKQKKKGGQNRILNLLIFCSLIVKLCKYVIGY